MKTIETKFVPATNHKSSRIKATEPDGISVTLSWDHSMSDEENHDRARAALCDRLGWNGPMIGGHTKRGMIWVFMPSATEKKL